MKHLKSVAIGAASAGLVLAVGFGAGAAARIETINAEFADIKIVLDGAAVSPKDANGNAVEPFIWNGTTYLPVRAVGTAIGKDVTWDNNSKTVYLGKAPEAPGTAYSRTNPAPVGTWQTLVYKDYFDEYTATGMVEHVMRGDAAWKMLQDANQFNSEPAAGNEYILVKFRATVNSTKGDAPVDFNSTFLTMYSTDYTQYQRASVVVPDPKFSGQTFKDGTLSGYAAFEVKIDDTNPKLVFGQSYDGTGGVWYNMTK